MVNMKKKTVDWPCNYLNESDPRSNVHYLSSSENKAWKKFRPVRDLNPWPLRYRCSVLPTELTSQLRAGHYAVYSSLHGFIHEWFIVRCSLFHYCSSSAHYCEDHFHSNNYMVSRLFFFFILTIVATLIHNSSLTVMYILLFLRTWSEYYDVMILFV